MTLVGAMAVLAVFQVGVFVGYRKASYSFRWGDNYHRMFAGPRHGFFDEKRGGPGGPPRPGKQKGPGGPEFMDAHGIFGTVLKNDGDILIIKDKDEVERAVTVTTSTVIHGPGRAEEARDIPANARVVIIGEPDEQGRIDAKLIRIFMQK